MTEGEEQTIDVGRGIELCVTTSGDRSAPPMLLVMGLGMQLIAWPAGLVEMLAQRGYFVVRFDNRDSGRSTSVRAPVPSLPRLLARRFARAQYGLSDMARDAAELTRAMELEPVHLVGASLGGMVAQTMACEHPDRVRSLTSIMANTGRRWKGLPAPSLMRWLIAPSPSEREAAIEHSLELFEAIGSPGFEVEADTLRAAIEASIDRAPNRAGTVRQLAAIRKSGDRTRALEEVAVPTLVVHGSADRLVRPSGGSATASAIPDARLMVVQGMGHDLPQAIWPRLVEAIDENARRSSEERTATT